jgi:hypothetical protein
VSRYPLFARSTTLTLDISRHAWRLVWAILPNDGTKVCGTSIASAIAPRMFEVQTSRRRRRRSSRNRRRELRAAAISVVAVFAVVAAFVSAVLFLEPLQEARIAPLTTAGETVIAHDLDLEPRDASPRTVYPFSVIPGGVYSAEEFAEAVATDAAVGSHYGDVTPAAMHVETVDAPRAAYMSYRIGDRIYWTKRKLALHEGERVLSDGGVTIRARCGNRLSDEPLQPTSDAEPPVQAFEGDPASPVVAAPAPALENGIEPPLTLAALPPSEPGMEPLSSSDPWNSVPFLGGIGSFGVGSVMSPLEEETVGSSVDDPTDPPIAFVFPGEGHYSDEGPGPNPPGGEHHDPPSVIVEVPGLTPLSPPSDDPPSNGPLLGGPPLGGPETPGGGPDGELPPVVPEPTSLTLFGTGAVWLAIKRYRQRGRSL